MNGAYTDEFNLNASSAEVRRRQLYHAVTGNESVFTAFAAANTQKLEAERRRKDENLESLARMVLASRERVEQFAKTLDRLDQASMQALLENEGKLRIARENLERIRERAFELTHPDGGVMKVYRDGRVVRDDGGAEVDPHLIKPEDIPAASPTWAERKSFGEAVERLQSEREKIIEYHTEVSKARDRINGGEISESDLDDLENQLQRDMPEAVQRKLGAEEQATKPIQKDATFEVTDRPTASFGAAALGLTNDDFNEPQMKPRTPTASKPAPM